MCRSPFFKGGSINGSFLARLTGINDRIAEGVSQIYLLQNDIDGRPMSFGNSFLPKVRPNCGDPATAPLALRGAYACLYVQGKGREQKGGFVVLTDSAVRPIYAYLSMRRELGQRGRSSCRCRTRPWGGG